MICSGVIKRLCGSISGYGLPVKLSITGVSYSYKYPGIFACRKLPKRLASVLYRLSRRMPLATFQVPLSRNRRPLLPIALTIADDPVYIVTQGQSTVPPFQRTYLTIFLIGGLPKVFPAMIAANALPVYNRFQMSSCRFYCIPCLSSME
jgi:hypothetical protein